MKEGQHKWYQAYEEKMERSGSPTLEEKRGRFDLITVYSMVKEMKIIDWELLAWDARKNDFMVKRKGAEEIK